MMRESDGIQMTARDHHFTGFIIPMMLQDSTTIQWIPRREISLSILAGRTKE